LTRLHHRSEIEVIMKDHLTPKYLFGNTKSLRFLMNASDGRYGVLSYRQLHQYGISVAECTKTRKAFEIHRNLLCLNHKTHDLYLDNVIELVGRDGRYQVTRRSFRKLPAAKVLMWSIPQFAGNPPEEYRVALLPERI